jgi:hypothetical protein
VIKVAALFVKNYKEGFQTLEVISEGWYSNLAKNNIIYKENIWKIYTLDPSKMNQSGVASTMGR